MGYILPLVPTNGKKTMGAMKIDNQAIKDLAELLTQTGLTEIEIADGDKSIRVTRSSIVQAFAPPALTAPANNSTTPALVPAASLDKHPGAIKSPMVGTVYLQPEPGSKPFAAKGDKVKIGDTLVIIEAMKVMNPIKAEKGGTVTQVIVDDGQPVEFGEVLMVIE